MTSRRLSNRLAVLAGQISDANHAMQRASREAAERALEIGHLLVEAKIECRHGEWLRFLAQAGTAERQAQRLMQLARSGLKSDTVSVLGIKAALELAGMRRLPSAGQVLMVDAPSAPGGNVWVWESNEHPGYFHVAGMARDYAFAEATRRPVSGEAPAMIFSYVDGVLEHRYDDLIFITLNLSKEKLESYRLAVIDDQGGDDDLVDRALDVINQATFRLDLMGGAA